MMIMMLYATLANRYSSPHSLTRLVGITLFHSNWILIGFSRHVVDLSLLEVKGRLRLTPAKIYKRYFHQKRENVVLAKMRMMINFLKYWLCYEERNTHKFN